MQDTLGHNYLVKIQQMWATGALPREAGYHQIAVYHDDWCSVFEGQRCNCDPDVTLRWSLPGHADN